MRNRRYSGIGPSGHQIAQNIVAARALRGVTTHVLADRLTELGVPIQPSGITRIEKGQRRVAADELVAFAVVLGVTPNSLLLPVWVDRYAPVQVSGMRGTASASQAWAWARGEAPLSGGVRDTARFRVDVNPWWVVAGE